MFDHEKILPMEAIREHCKIDDVPSVSDFQLTLYRKGALEAAEKYTGLMLSGREDVTESVTPPYGHTPGKSFVHRTKKPIADDYVWYYGLKHQAPEQVSAEIGARRVVLPRRHDQFGLGCHTDWRDGPATAMIKYSAGFNSESDIPAAILLGSLKMIAHLVENAGDNVIAANQSGGVVSSGLAVDAASNPALASGAIDMWRTCVDQTVFS